MLGLVDTLDKEVKVPGKEKVWIGAVGGILETLQGETDVRIALLSAQLRNALSSKPRCFAQRQASCFDISQSNVLVEVDGKI